LPTIIASSIDQESASQFQKLHRKKGAAVAIVSMPGAVVCPLHEACILTHDSATSFVAC
jgi:hypothetical protein